MNINKGRRNELKFLHYKRRIKRFVRNEHAYIKQSGERILNPKAVDVIKDNGMLCYRNTSTPCSCYVCSGEHYSRHKEKIKTYKILQDEIN